MSFLNIDPGVDSDDAFFNAFDQEIQKKKKEKPDPEPRDPRKQKTRPHDHIPDVQVIDAPAFSITNPSETWETTVSEYCFPLTLEATVALVKLTETENKKVRAIGQRHSFSQTCLTDGAFIDLSKAHPYNPKKHNDTVDKLDQSSLSLLKDDVDARNYFDVPGGMQIFMINKILCPEHKGDKVLGGMRRRMFNMGGGDVQSFAGAFSTGTHGSGGIHSAYHDMVRSILLVAGDGKVYRIEPENGLTDPSKHAQFYDSRIELIQNDDKFYSALVSFGCFGVIYSAIIETKPMVFLHKEIIYQSGGWSEQVIKTTIDLVMSSLKDREEIFHFLYFNPYPVGDNLHPSYLTKTLTVVENEEKVEGKDENIQKWPAAYTKWPWVGDFIRILTNHKLSPPRRLIESVLKMQRKDNGRRDLAYRIWNAGTSGRLMTIGTGIEFAFPVEEVPEILKSITAHLNQIGNQDRGFYVNGPIALRFVRASKAFLAPNCAKFKTKEYDWWCFIEIVRINSSDREADKREMELYKHLQKIQATKGRPHWGLNFEFPFDLNFLKENYPDIDKWIAAKHFFDPKGAFESRFVELCLE
ncbi:MAG: D-arabinono-1,4-lactone oxidase [Haliscomenobacter sp.]|uniref:D-arabinono-1,4-lactone oxidase n=1 Tax=Haliscomenobacter sp. TaxID=2717303 RepID=UPI0029BD934A|nr:D-arabinono-1,4-lactone oxidase [Haliscomenobacter sp.]MDX2068316.1 D-arabinono-1,4-lactone oxidase [Haliscomenobacter sp.]